MAGYPVNNSVQEEMSSRYLTLDKLVHVSNAQWTSFADITLRRIKMFSSQTICLHWHKDGGKYGRWLGSETPDDWQIETNKG